MRLTRLQSGRLGPRAILSGLRKTRERRRCIFPQHCQRAGRPPHGPARVDQSTFSLLLFLVSRLQPYFLFSPSLELTLIFPGRSSLHGLVRFTLNFKRFLAVKKTFPAARPGLSVGFPSRREAVPRVRPCGASASPGRGRTVPAGR